MTGLARMRALRALIAAAMLTVRYALSCDWIEEGEEDVVVCEGVKKMWCAVELSLREQNGGGASPHPDPNPLTTDAGAGDSMVCGCTSHCEHHSNGLFSENMM